jgi:hypothetical protein
MKSLFEQERYFVAGHDIVHEPSFEIDVFIKENNINVVVGATGSTIMSSNS